MSSRLAGFTLIEIVVALVVGGMAVAVAAALLLGLGDRADAIKTAAARVDRDANAERLLRSLLGNLDLGGDGPLVLGGDETSVSFRSWCASAGGWLDRCGARLFIERRREGSVVRVEVRAAADTSVVDLWDAPAGARLRYLVDPANGGRWADAWRQIAVPRGIAVIVDADTLLIPVWGRG
jgi:prepilin-type N-terminal cleavage/methylation domain-containing protein